MTTTTQPPLTTRQREIRDWIEAYIGLNGFSPSIRELCDAFGFKTPNGGLCHLRPLRRKGVVSWIDGRPRTLRVLVDPNTSEAGK